MKQTKLIRIGLCVCILNSFLCHAHGKEFFNANILPHIPDTSINISAIEVADTNIYFTDFQGIHYQCDYQIPVKGFIRLSDGTRIWIEIEGKGSPLLLIQGGPGYDHRYFHPHFSELASEHTLIYTDLRGRYMSEESTADKCNILQDIHDLEDIRKQLGIQQWNILGHSFGGYIVMVYAELYPQSIKSAITVSTPFGYTHNQYDSVTTVLLSTYAKDMKTKEGCMKALIETSFYLTPREDIISYTLQAFSSYDSYEKFKIIKNNYLVNTEESFEKYIGEEPNAKNISLLPVSLMVMAGKQDYVGFWRETEQLIKEKQPHATICIFENSSHFPWIEENEKFMRIVKEWLSKNK
jgi:proline iminopeptidase